MFASPWFFCLAPPALAALLCWRRPVYRSIGLGFVLGYVLAIAVAVTITLFAVAQLAETRVILSEIGPVTWFVVSWHLIWLVWFASAGRVGERFVRWGRLRRFRGQAVSPLVSVLPFARGAVVVLAFGFLLVGALLTHRCKWADGRDPLHTQALPYSTVRISRPDGARLEGWFVPREGARRTLVIFPGAGANKGNFVWFLGPLRDLGYNLAIFDLRAHGGSDGWVTTWGIAERDDVLAVVSWLARERAAEAEKIVALGSSQGAMAVALAAAVEPRISAVVLDSPFVSHRRWAQAHARVIPVLGPWLADGMLRVMSAWSGVDFLGASAVLAVAKLGARPVMIVHGASDALMPESDARALLTAATGPRELWLGPGTHSNVVTADPEAYRQHVGAFLEKYLGAAH